jgi:anti-anti-sigma factor
MATAKGMRLRGEPFSADGFFVHVTGNSDGDRDGTNVIVSGELDLTTCDALQQHVAVLVDPRHLVTIDLRDVTFMDSTGLRALWTIHQNLLASGGHLRLKSPSDSVRRVLEITRLEAIFDIAS